jgi:hypothetical protein
MLEHLAVRERGGSGVAMTKPGALYLVNHFELESLSQALRRGEVPADLEAKLRKLAAGNLTERSVERSSRLFIALIQASQSEAFRGARSEDLKRLLQVLAYVRKDDDEIPDYKSDGFVDDNREVQAAKSELRALLESFKSWRLIHQVPELWWA